MSKNFFFFPLKINKSPLHLPATFSVVRGYRKSLNHDRSDLELVDEKNLKNEFKISELPQSVWPHILKFIDHKELSNLQLVSKRWRDQVNNDAHWMQRVLRLPNQHQSPILEDKKQKNLSWKDSFKSIFWTITINSTFFSGWVGDLSVCDHFKVSLPFYATVQEFLDECKKNEKNNYNYRVSISTYRPFQNKSFKANCTWKPLHLNQSIRDAGLVNGGVLAQEAMGVCD